MRPLVRSTAKLNGLRSPRAQMAWLMPVVWEKNGLSDGIEPSALMRSTLPSVVVRDCELALLAFSPTAMYSLPSVPKWIAPPLWLVAELRLGRFSNCTSLPAATTFGLAALAVNRLRRL